MKVKIKKIYPYVKTPSYSKIGDAGLDLIAVDMYYDDQGNIVYNTGLCVEIPEGYVGLLFPRSSIAKYNVNLSNAVGVIDSNYRGEILFKFKAANPYHNRTNEYPSIYNVGDRIGQLIIMPYPQIEFEEVEELSATERGTGGYGSTGN